MNLNFRSALNGFNRQDVARYLEYLNTQHNAGGGGPPGEAAAGAGE